jgi:hypothetical protein
MFTVKGTTSDEFEVRDEAQFAHDGLTIKHVH